MRGEGEEEGRGGGEGRGKGLRTGRRCEHWANFNLLIATLATNRTTCCIMNIIKTTLY